MDRDSSAQIEASAQASTFGQFVRYYRRQCSDPQRGGLLTQDRLGELIGDQMGDAGYTGAAVSEWERDKSKIHASDRLVLLSLLAVLFHCGGISDSGEADALLAAGNYRRLNSDECLFVFGEQADLQAAVEPTLASGAVESSPAEAPPSRRAKQLILLEKVSSFWVDGVLDKSTQGSPLITIPQAYVHEAVDHPWGDHLGEALIVDVSAGSPMSIYESYLRADRALLILGGPGSGKTTLLISLAEELIAQAREDWRQPVPVILDLSSWARLPLDLASWVVEELTAKYQIPRRYGRKWVAANELTLLLDGLDTLPLPERRSCIAAINAFRESHGLTGLAVCCRSREYESADSLLRLNGAIALEPLDEEGLNSYLAQGDEAMQGLAAALDESVELCEMAHNPLMLNIMTAVFKESTINTEQSEAISETTVTDEMLFDAYVKRMFAQRVADAQYTPQRTEQWLSWLAEKMTSHSQNIFLIEQMQPSWLPGKRWRKLYLLLSGSITGIAGGIIMWLLWRLLRYTLPQLPSPTSTAVAGLFGIPLSASEPITIIFGNLVLGLLLGVTLIILFEQRLGEPADAEEARQQRSRQVVLVGLETGFAAFLFVALFSEPLLAVAWGVAEGFMYAAAARYIFGWSYQTEIRTVEALAWSWPHAAVGALVGLALAVVAEVLESLLYGYNGFARTAITLATAGFVLGGLRGRSTDTKSRPNQGVWLSLRNAIVAAIVLSIPLTVLAWFIRDPGYAWQIGLLSAVIAAALMGGSVLLKHFMLRAILRYKGLVPWRYARFLDYCAHLVLLRKVGNGYIFIHGLMQAYFAKKL